MRTEVIEAKKCYWGKVGEVAEFLDGSRYYLVGNGPPVRLDGMKFKINIHHEAFIDGAGNHIHSLSVILPEQGFFAQIPFRDDISTDKFCEVLELFAKEIRERGRQSPTN